MTTKLSTPTEQTPLPAGWRWARLGDLVREAQSGFAVGERDPNGVIQLRMNNVTTSGTFDWSSFIRVPADAKAIDFYRLIPGDVLFNNTNSTELVGKSALFENHEETIVYSNHFTRLRTDPEALAPQFLALWLQDEWQHGVFANICNRWIGQSGVKNDKLLSLGISLPPLPEQRRIAARLNEVMAEIAHARASAQTALDAANVLPAALLRAVFESDEARGWERKRLGEMCEIVARQVDPKLPEYANLSHISGENIESVTCRLTYLNTAGQDQMTSGKYVFESGDVLYNKLRPYLRKVVVVDFGGVCSADMYPIRVNRDLLDPHFTAWMLLSEGFTNCVG